MSKYYAKKNEQIWDTIANSFDKTRRKPWIQCIEFIKTISKTDIVADIGCGNGRHLIPCTKYCNQVIGFDISTNMLKIIKNKLNDLNIINTSLIHSDITDLPINNNSFDKIIYIATLHNIKGRKNRVKTLIELKRVLKPKGLALISIWSRWQDQYRKYFFLQLLTKTFRKDFGDINIYWKQNNLSIPRFYHLYSKREFIKDLKNAELEILNIKEVKIHSKKYPDNYFALVTH